MVGSCLLFGNIPQLDTWRPRSHCAVFRGRNADLGRRIAAYGLSRAANFSDSLSRSPATTCGGCCCRHCFSRMRWGSVAPFSAACPYLLEHQRRLPCCYAGLVGDAVVRTRSQLVDHRHISRHPIRHCHRWHAHLRATPPGRHFRHGAFPSCEHCRVSLCRPSACRQCHLHPSSPHEGHLDWASG